MRIIPLIAILSMSLAAQPDQHSRLIVLDPGHFHATLLQKDMYPELDSRVSVYAPLGSELLDYLNRISLFNNRSANPTRWQLDVHTSNDPMAGMLHAARQPGDIVLFSGRNRGKIDRILASLSGGLHVLADKPWIIASADLLKLDRALGLAEEKGLAAYDIMTERYEVTSQLQRELVNASDVFGSLVNVHAKSIHHVMKVVAGVPLRRPAWFFDVADYGEGLADVGTHPVDLIQWTAFPEQMIDYRKDIRMISGRHNALQISLKQFKLITGAPEFPASLKDQVHDGVLNYYCNNYIEYALKGIPVKLDVLWAWEAMPGTGDVYEAAFQGTRARVEIRQGAAEKFLPEVYVVPEQGSSAAVLAALNADIARLQKKFPGISALRSGNESRIVIPQTLRVGHEEHFAQVASHFFEYVQSPKSLPAWERGYMLAKYYVSTKGVEMSQGK